MDNEQPPLWDETTHTQPNETQPQPQQTQARTTPPQPITCPACLLRPVRWNQAQHNYSRYCGGKQCGNPQSTCRSCNTIYTRGQPGAGTRYCSDKCKYVGYTKGTRPPQAPPTLARCANCKQETRTTPEQRALICTQCRARYAKAITAYRLDTTWALRLIHATRCDSCGDKLLRDRGRHKGVVDHDHTCCNGPRSCGQCVRGILCQQCNFIAGMIENQADRIKSIKQYLHKAHSTP